MAEQCSSNICLLQNTSIVGLRQFTQNVLELESNCVNVTQFSRVGQMYTFKVSKFNKLFFPIWGTILD